MRLINADDLSNKVADLYSEGEEATEADKVVNDVIDLIDNAPTVEQSYQAPKDYIRNKLDYSRPQGEWITHPHSMIMRCSLCGNEETTKNVGTVNADKHFCSNCGADMRVKNELNNELNELKEGEDE